MTSHLVFDGFYFDFDNLHSQHTDDNFIGIETKKKQTIKWFNCHRPILVQFYTFDIFNEMRMASLCRARFHNLWHHLLTVLNDDVDMPNIDDLSDICCSMIFNNIYLFIYCFWEHVAWGGIGKLSVIRSDACVERLCNEVIRVVFLMSKVKSRNYVIENNCHCCCDSVGDIWTKYIFTCIYFQLSVASFIC